MISQMLSVKFASKFIVNLLGVWNDAGGGRAYPIGGLWPASSSHCWTSCSRRAPASPSTSPPTSAGRSSTPTRALSSRTPSSPCSTCSPQGRTRSAPSGGFLPPELAQPDKPRHHGPNLQPRHLLPGLPRRPADQACSVPRPVQQLPHQAVSTPVTPATAFSVSSSFLESDRPE